MTKLTPQQAIEVTVNFEKAKHQINSEILSENYFTEDEFQWTALHFFSALDRLSHNNIHTNEIKGNQQYLTQLQEAMLEKSIIQLLEKYSEGFILGALSNALRRFEASIKTADKYDKAYTLLKNWKQMGASEEISVFLDNSLEAAEEILGWVKNRTQALLPIGIRILELYIKSGSSHLTQIVEDLMTGFKEKEIFFFLSGTLQVNISLRTQLSQECEKKKINSDFFLEFLEKILEHFRTAAKDKEIRGLVELFLRGYNSYK